MRADLRRFYTLDLDAALAERSVRPTALLDLIEHLPQDAAVWRAIDPDTAWDLPAMLLALLVDEVRVLRWEFERANFKGRPPQPEPIPRPGVTPKAEVETVGKGDGFDTVAEFEAWYAQAKARQQPS